MRRKIILIILVVLSLAMALGYSYEFCRLAIIRSTINLPLPGWCSCWCAAWWWAAGRTGTNKNWEGASASSLLSFFQRLPDDDFQKI